MPAPIEALFSRVSWSCGCCGEPVGGRNCACFDGSVDRCEVEGWCASHCLCEYCKWNRESGFVRVNWTGRPHVARAENPVTTLCGTVIPKDVRVWSKPMLRQRPADASNRECFRCALGYARLLTVAC